MKRQIAAGILAFSVLLTGCTQETAYQLPELVPGNAAHQEAAGGSSAEATAQTGQNAGASLIQDLASMVPEAETCSIEDLKKEIPYYGQRYYLNHLDEDIQENFLIIYRTAAAFEEMCVLPHLVDSEEMEILQYLLCYECPELLHFPGGGFEVWTRGQGTDYTFQEVHLQYAMDEKTSQTLYLQCESMAQAIADEARRETDGSEQALERYAYDYLTERIWYTLDAPNSGNAAGALVDGKAKCDGISLGMKWVCEKMGLTCLILAGQENGDPVGHAWNIVGTDGSFYDVDLTLDVRGEGKPQYCMYPAYNVSRTWIRDNYPVKEVYSSHFLIPGSISMKQSYHALEDEFFEAGESCWQYYCDRLDEEKDNEDKKCIIQMQFASQSDFNGFVSSVGDMHQDWVNSRRVEISSNMLRNDHYRTVSMEITFRD